jgi:predicted RNA-binding Zn-ribbon protein involved in translation (DUF1610 family)
MKKALSSPAPYEIVAAEAMSEFKFACPVCGQHITADSSTSGGHLECPTCFQKIVVPQAPASAETKFILSASQVSKPRPASADTSLRLTPPSSPSARMSTPVVVALLLLLCAAGAAIFVFRDQIVKAFRPRAAVWSLELAKAAFPSSVAAGSLHGSIFSCQRAILEGGSLTLRQGRSWPPDLAVTIGLHSRPGEDFTGKTIQVTTNQPPPVPRLVLRWKDDQQKPASQVIKGGYALKLAFGQPADGRLPGKIYLCLPDEAKSLVAGTFDAELRKPKPSQPKSPKPKE